MHNSYPTSSSSSIPELLKALQEYRDFNAIWTHELGNLALSISGFAGLIDKNKLDPNSKELFDVLLQGCQLLIDFKNNIAAFNGNFDEVTREDFSLKDWITELINIYAVTARIKGMAVALEIDAKVPPIIHCDLLKLSQIFTNLLLNAIKFSPLEKKITIKVFCEGKNFCISVSNEGKGIPNDKIDEIFKPFARLDRNTAGMGLGLTICKKNADALGGSIKVQSIPGIETTFIVSLPLPDG